ncbi:MAG: class I SAM-dependent methyltransferase [Candidatus Aquicultorales bacterium]
MKTAFFNKSVHLNEEQLTEIDETCPFCSSTDRREVFRIQEAPDIHLVGCSRCHAVSASRMPTESFLKEYYNSYYEGKGQEVTIDSTDKLANHIYESARASIEVLRDVESFRILDFGGGDGEVSVRLGMKIAGKDADRVSIALVDYNAREREVADGIGMESFTSLSEIEGREFELVIASAIIEHIPYPSKDIEALLRAVRKGGVFYARTPFVLPFMKALRKFGAALDFTYPGHVHDLGRDFWENSIATLSPEGADYRLLLSRPSVVETTFGKHFARTLLAHLFKAPWKIHKGYSLVGGWEVFITRSTSDGRPANR